MEDFKEEPGSRDGPCETHFYGRNLIPDGDATWVSSLCRLTRMIVAKTLTQDNQEAYNREVKFTEVQYMGTSED